MINSILTKLKTSDDVNFTFDHIKHKYSYNGEHFISVTQFISTFHNQFDSDYWSKFKSEESGKSQYEILNEWKQLNDRSNEIGTATHLWIENYYRKKYQPLPNDIDIIYRINKFNIAYSKYLHKLQPVAFEQRIFSKKWKIAGMIDSIFVYNDKIIIVDYKTNELHIN